MIRNYFSFLVLLTFFTQSAFGSLPPISTTGQSYIQATGPSVINASPIDLATNSTGVLGITRGGTNSNAALGNNRVIISSGGKLVEQSGLATGRVLVTDSFGLPIVSSVTTTTLGYVDPTSSIQTQFGALNSNFSNYIPLTQKASANGVASLDGGGTIPLAQIPSAITGGLHYKGVWNALTNSPSLSSGVGTTGDFYDVSTAGTTCLDGVCSWEVQDFPTFNGTTWEKIPNSVAVSSVNGFTGAVSLNTDSVSEGSTNKYFTNSRSIGSLLTSYSAAPGTVSSVDSVIGAIEKIDGNLQSFISGSVSSVFGRTGSVVAQSGDYTTDQVTEGSNLYFTDARAQGAFSFSGSLTSSSGATSLINDNATPGASKYYGTDSGGTKGFYSLPATTSGTVTSVAFSDTSSTPIYSVSGSPVTTSGTLSVSLNSQSPNQAFLSPNGSSGQPGFRALVGADLPTPTLSTLGGVEAISAVGSKWISSIDTSGVPHISQPSFSDISGASTLSQLPSIATGTFLGNNLGSTSTPVAVTSTQATAMLNQFSSSLQGLAPASGGGTSNFLRADGTWATPVGSVTSVSLADGSSTAIFNISGSPVTSSGTLTETLKTQSSNIVFAGPTTGAAAQPTFRSLVGADLPNPSSATLGGVKSLASTTSKWINQISTSGVPSATQPDFSDLTGSATLAQLPSISNSSVLGNVSGSSSSPSALTTTQLTTLVNTFTSSLSGSAPASGGGTSNFLRADGSWAAPPSGSGSVSNVSVFSANGFAGTVATATTTPVITLSTTVTGLLKGNGTAISAASSGTDYQTPLTFSTGLLNSSGTVTSKLASGAADTTQGWASGLGAITHLQGPTDQTFALNAGTASGAGTAGNGINLTATAGIAGVSVNGGAGGSMTLQMGLGAASTNNDAGNGGDFSVFAGNSSTNGASASGGTQGRGGNITLLAGNSGGTVGAPPGGSVSITAGNVSNTGGGTLSGQVVIAGGTKNANTNSGAVVIKTVGNGTGSGPITITTGTTTAPVSPSGITLTVGSVGGPGGNAGGQSASPMTFVAGQGVSAGTAANFTGGQSSDFIFTATAGGSTVAGSGTATAGRATNFVFNGASGGASTATATAATAGQGSSLLLTAGNGAPASGVSTTNTAGAAGIISLVTGNGALASNGTTNNSTSGGAFSVLTGIGGASNTTTGAISLLTGTGTTTMNSGSVTIQSGAVSQGSSGAVTIGSGAPSSNGTGGPVSISTANNAGGGASSTLTISTSNATTTAVAINGGPLAISTGNGSSNATASGTSGNGGTGTITTGNGGSSGGATSVGGNGGNLVVNLGSRGTGTSTNGIPGQMQVNGKTVFTMPALTALAASTEYSDLVVNGARTVQFGTGSLTNQRAAYFQAPTYSFVGASTVTNAATVAISGAPIPSTNATFTNNTGLLIESNASSSGASNTYGLVVNAPTGSGNNIAAYFNGNVGVGTAIPGKQFKVVSSNETFSIDVNGGLQNVTTGNSAWANFGGGDTSTPTIAWYDNSNVIRGKFDYTGDLVMTPSASTTGTQGPLSINQTWNTTSTLTGIFMNITDTASNAASLFMDLQKSTVSQFKVSKTGDVTAAGNIIASIVGKGLQIKSGVNGRIGTATLVGGTVIVANTSVTANSLVFLTTKTPGGTQGAPYISSQTAGVGFTITSTNALDTSTVGYMIVESN